MHKRDALLRAAVVGFMWAISATAHAGLMKMPGQLKVTEAGSVSYSTPIVVPPGTADIEPELVLNYDSHAGNSLIGAGWSLSGLSVISLCPRTIEQDGVQGGVNYDVKDRFCLDGQRLVPEDGSYSDYGQHLKTYRTEIETFSHIVSDSAAAGGGPLSFKVRTKSGLVLEYGASENSRAYVQGRNRVHIWAISRMSDVKGNYITFSYEKNEINGEIYIDAIDYTGNLNTSTLPNARVTFSYESRPDEEPMYAGGGLIKLTKRLDQIQTYVASSIVRRYQFEYDVSPSTKASRLTSITDCALTSSGQATCKPATQFSYYDQFNPYFDHNTLWIGPQGVNSGGFFSMAANAILNERRRTVDFNGDGRTDLLQGGDGTVARVCMSNGTAFNCEDWTASFSVDETVVFGDFDADGRTDMAKRGSGSTWHVCRSTGLTFSCATRTGPNSDSIIPGDYDGDGRMDLAYHTGSFWSVCLSRVNSFTCENRGNNPPTGSISGDFNGDARTDLIKRTSGRTWTVCLSIDSGFVCNPWTGTAAGAPAADFNGDGLSDLADHLSGNNWEICLSTGAGFSCSTQVATGSAGIYGDFNGDGKADLAQRVSGQTWNVCLAEGMGFACSNWTSGTPAGTLFPLVGDVDGDGASDLIQHISGNQWQVAKSGYNNTDRLTQVNNGIGYISNIEYSPLQTSTIYSKAIGATYPEADVIAPIDVVSRVTASNGIGGTLSTTYRYGGMRINYAGRGSLGFRWMESTEVATGITVRTEYRQDWPYIGRPSLMQKKISSGGNGGLLYEASYGYSCITQAGASCSSGTLRFFPHISSQSERSWDLNGATLPQVTTTTQYDEYGNPTQVVTSNGAGYSTTTTSTYNNNLTTWQLGRLVLASVNKQAPNVPNLTRTSAFTYDAMGLLNKEVVEPSNSLLCAVTTYAYDAHGNNASSTIRNCNGSSLAIGFEAQSPTGQAAFGSRSSSVGYDSRGQFPVTSTNAMGHEQSQTFNPRDGTMISMTGPNGLTTTWEYDVFGRKTKETRADGSYTTWLYRLCALAAQFDCPELAVYVVFSQNWSEGGNQDLGAVYYDVADRIVRTRTVGLDGQYIYEDTEYDGLGRVARTSRPRFASQTLQWTIYGYDAVGRPETVLAPNGGVTTTYYNGLTTTVKNAKNQTEVRVVNSLGQIVSIKDADNNLLTYHYDAYGNITSTVDPFGNTVATTYDLRGRKVQVSDPDMGVWGYGYNALGEVVRQFDSKAQTTTFEYDLLGRMTRRIEPDLVSSWFYDKYPSGLLGLPVACGKSVGKLCRASSDNDYDRTYRYDSLGRPDRVQTKIGTTTYTSETSYDAQSRVSVVDYPTLFGVKHVYQGLFLKEVRNKTSNALYWQANAADAEGNLLQQTYGNNVVTHQAFEASTGNLKSILAGPGNVVQNLEYQYDTIGNVSSRKDNNQTLNETFSYDNLNRLEFATVNSPGAGLITTQYGYDVIGNLRLRSDLGAYSYNTGVGAQRPHAVTSILTNSGSSITYTYDANGNQVQEVHRDPALLVQPALTRSTTYTSFNLPQTIGRAGTTLSFVYGPEHQRIKQQIGNVTTVYVHPDNAGGLQYEKETSPTKTEQRFFVAAMGQVVAVVKKNGLGAVTGTTYWHRDALGSVAAVTNESGNVLERFAYEPFGKRRAPSGAADPNGALAGAQTDRGFTGHEHLDEMGLIHMNGRVYDPTIGRFMSADPVIQDGQGLQTYNRYSYTINNPLMYTDPTGNIFGIGSEIKRFGRRVGRELARWERDFRHEIRRPNSLLGPILRVAGAALAIGCGPASPGCVAAVVGGTEASVSRAQGVTGSDLLRATVISAASAAAFSSVGRAHQLGNIGDYGRYAAHSAIGCFSAAASGGNCGQGAAAAFLGVWTTTTFDGNFVAAVVAGGIGSRITGGKFVNGAVTAAFGYLLNDRAHRRKLPSADTLYDNYPAPNPDGSPAHPSAAGYENQCAIRVSVTLEESNFSLDTYPDVNKSPEGYARSSQGLADYLWKEVGPPLIVSPEDFASKYYSTFKGIVYLKPPPGGTGHIDVWNASRSQPYGSGYYTSSEVWMFKAP